MYIRLLEQYLANHLTDLAIALLQQLVYEELRLWGAAVQHGLPVHCGCSALLTPTSFVILGKLLLDSVSLSVKWT